MRAACLDSPGAPGRHPAAVARLAAGSLLRRVKGQGLGLTGEESAQAQLSEAEEVRRRVEELRRKLYARAGVRYEDDPELHDELDRLILRYVQLTRRRRGA